jgi:glycosyltransferase involved in cell wall biosynthesis
MGARRAAVPLAGSSFLVATSGVAEGPSQALSRYLVEQGASAVHVLAHPLVREAANEHRLEQLVGDAPSTRVVHRPNRPPITYLFDPITPLRLPKVDVWVGFNCLATAQGLMRRRVGRVRRVVHWSVDFVPQRFGPGMLTRVYDALDRHCIRSADARVELSDAAFRGRLESYGLQPGECPAQIVPMGSWSSDVPTTDASSLASPRLVFLGHLVERMGVPLAVDTIASLRARGRDVALDVVGGGPLLDDLRSAAAARGVADLVTFHGFVEDFADVERVLAGASIGLAPYDDRGDSFSRFADPGKLKAYLAAGLPILMTGVPPNSADLERTAGAHVLPFDAERFADAVVELLDDAALWHQRHRAAVDAARRDFDWNHLFARALPELGITL